MALFKRKSIASHQETNRAYLVYAEWGPNLSIPRDQRLRDEFPQVDETKIQAWITEFDAVRGEISRLAELGGPKTYSLQAFGGIMRQKFPWMDEPSLRFAHTVMGYYAFVDGYA
jgi:hypothetical protein